VHALPPSKTQSHHRDVAHIVHEQWILGDLEGLLPMRLQAKGTPDAADSCLRHPHFARNGRGAPVPGALRQDSRVLATTASTRASSMVRGAPGRGASTKPSSRCSTKRARLGDRLLRHALTCGYRPVVGAVSTRQHDARAQRQCLGALFAAASVPQAARARSRSTPIAPSVSPASPPRRIHT